MTFVYRSAQDAYLGYHPIRIDSLWVIAEYRTRDNTWVRIDRPIDGQTLFCLAHTLKKGKKK